MSEHLEITSSVRGYHVYQHIRIAVVGEELDWIREPTNGTDILYVVVVIKNDEMGAFCVQLWTQNAPTALADRFA